MYVFGPWDFWPMASLRYAAVPPPQRNPRKGRDQILPSGNLDRTLGERLEALPRNTLFGGISDSRPTLSASRERTRKEMVAVAECKVGRASEQVVVGNFFRLTNDHWDQVGGTAINVRLLSPSSPFWVVAAAAAATSLSFQQMGLGGIQPADSHVGTRASQIRLSLILQIQNTQSLYIHL